MTTSLESVVILIDGRPTRVSKGWIWENCDGQGGRKTVKDFPLAKEAPK